MPARHDRLKLHDWICFGSDATLRSYSTIGRPGSLTDVPREHWIFLEQTVPWHQTETHSFVYANAYPDWPLSEQPDDMLF